MSENQTVNQSLLITSKPTTTTEPKVTPNALGNEIVQRFYIDQTFFYVNDKKTTMDTASIIKNGRTFLPVRYVAESLGASVVWDQTERKISVALTDRTVEMHLDVEVALVNGTVKEIDVPPFIQNGRTLVPFRFLSEALGCKVEWDSQKRCVTFYNKAYVNNHP